MANIFISYGYNKGPLKDRGGAYLAVLATEGLLVWGDPRIWAGADWESELTNALAAGDVAVLLISKGFLRQGVKVLLQRRYDQGIRVIPVILSVGGHRSRW